MILAAQLSVKANRHVTGQRAPCVVVVLVVVDAAAAVCVYQLDKPSFTLRLLTKNYCMFKWQHIIKTSVVDGLSRPFGVLAKNGLFKQPSQWRLAVTQRARHLYTDTRTSSLTQPFV